jgi:hypothetical protein
MQYLLTCITKQDPRPQFLVIINAILIDLKLRTESDFVAPVNKQFIFVAKVTFSVLEQASS